MKNSNQVVEHYENIGRKKLEKSINILFKGYEQHIFGSMTDSYDCAIKTETKKYFVEVKNRLIDSDKYSTSLIRCNKFDFLMSAVRKDYIPLFICFYEDGYGLAWDLRKVNKGDVVMINGKNPVKNNRYELMPHYELNVAEAIKFKY